MYRNPIIPGFNPDPSITFFNGTYYIATSTFEFFPGITIWESKDIVNWKYCTSVLTNEKNLNLSKAENSSGLYAASIRVSAEGRFYVVCTNKFTHENFICHTDNIRGKWSDISFICSDGIDPSLLFLPDGRCFYTSNGTVDGIRCIKGAFIDPDCGKLLEDFKVITTGCGGGATEGPHIYLIKGKYYLMFAEGGTGYGHHECIMRSDCIYGPYEKCPFNPILSHVSRKGHLIQATGHADLISLQNGETYAVFLGIRVKPRPLLHHLGRETFLSNVSFFEGWPVIGNNGYVEIENESYTDQIQNTDYSVLFSNDYHSYPYLKVRSAREDCYIQDTKNRTLTLKGDVNISSHLAHPVLLGFRQRNFNDRMKVFIDTSSISGNAGISCFLNSDYHYRLETEKKDKDIAISLIRHIHDFEAVTESITVQNCDTICLEVHSSIEKYEFYANSTYIGSAVTYGLASEGTMYNTFTGVLFAIYSQHGQVTFKDGIYLYD